MATGISFNVTATDGAARTGVISTPRGQIRTPAFMPVGTAGTVKAMLPDSVAAEMPADRFWYVNRSCVVAAANRYAVTVQILEAIILVESEGDPHAVNVNRDGKGDRRGPLSFKQATDLVAELWKAGANFDVGIAQINSVHMRQYKIDPVHFLDPCINIQWAAFVLRQKINEYQETWTAVGRYNGSRNIAGYSWKVYRALERLAGIRRARGLLR